MRLRGFLAAGGVATAAAPAFLDRVRLPALPVFAPVAPDLDPEAEDPAVAVPVVFAADAFVVFAAMVPGWQFVDPLSYDLALWRN